MNDLDRPLTVGEVAELFRCHPETIKRQAKLGTLPAFKLGKYWYFRRSDIQKFMEDAVQARAGIKATTRR